VHIVAFGQGGFSDGDSELDRYIVALARRHRPTAAFVSAASSDPLRYFARFADSFTRLGCTCSHLSLPHTGSDLRAFVESQDIIYVGGGSARKLMAAWEEHGLGDLLAAAWRAGTVLAGISAGAVAWFEYSLTSQDGQLGPTRGLGLLPGSCCVHYHSDPARRPTFHALIGDGMLPSGIALGGGAAVHFRGEKPHRLLKRSPGDEAYHVRRTFAGLAAESPLVLPQP